MHTRRACLTHAAEFPTFPSRTLPLLSSTLTSWKVVHENLAIPLVCFTGIISAIGALIHFAAIAGGTDWYVFFNALPQFGASSCAGTWLAPLSTSIIGLLIAVRAAYAFSALGSLPHLPFPRLMLGGMAGVCLLRALVIVPLAINHPQLRNTFEVVRAVIWAWRAPASWSPA